MNENINDEILMKAASEIASKAYAPYSKIEVGAAIVGSDGNIYTGCNVENRSFGLTVCAERNAIFTAVGKGITHFSKLAIFCSNTDYPLSPCGACRQVISEFCKGDFPVLFSNGKETVNTTINELFPFDGLNELKK